MDRADERRAWEGGWAVVARIGDRRVAFPATEVRSVMPVPPLWRPPTTPRPIFGFLPMGESVLPVLNGGVLLGIATVARPTVYAHILILPGLGATGAGLLVDRADDTVTIAAEVVLPLDPADTLNGCAVALAETADGPVHVLSSARLIAAAEADALAALAAEAERRLAEWELPA
jgi:purine-binding chemotaxis protein CheW